jgi:hypothetical protein
MHVETVLAHVPPEQRCRCAQQGAGRKSPFAALARWLGWS